MSLFADLRSVVLLRRIAIAQERLAAAAEETNRILRSHWGIREKRLTPSLTEITSFDTAAANKQWHEERAALGISEEDDR
jgi:hypothetical protein